MPSVRLISALSANCCLTNVRLNKGIVNQNLVKNEKKTLRLMSSSKMSTRIVSKSSDKIHLNSRSTFLHAENFNGRLISLGQKTHVAFT